MCPYTYRVRVRDFRPSGRVSASSRLIPFRTFSRLYTAAAAAMAYKSHDDYTATTTAKAKRRTVYTPKARRRMVLNFKVITLSGRVEPFPRLRWPKFT